MLHPNDDKAGQPDRNAEIEIISSIPALPSVVAHALRMTENEEYSVDSLVAALEADHAFTTRLLRVANSAFYGMAQEIYTVRDAIIVIGFEAVHALAISAAVVCGVWVKDELFEPKQFWGHSLTCGLFAEAVAKRLRCSKPEVAFTLGIIHDIGRIAIMQSDPERCRRVYETAARDKVYLFKAEKLVLGFDHAEIGAAMSEKWRLPASYTQAIRHHHTPETVTTDREITYALALANALSHYAFSEPATRAHAQPLYRGLWEPMGLTEADVRSILELQPQILDRAKSFYNSVTM